MVPDFLVDPSKVKLRHSVLSNLKEGMADHLLGVRQSKIVMAKDIVCTLASSSNMGSRRSVADVLGVDRRNLKGIHGKEIDTGYSTECLLVEVPIYLSLRCLACFSDDAGGRVVDFRNHCFPKPQRHCQTPSRFETICGAPNALPSSFRGTFQAFWNHSAAGIYLSFLLLVELAHSL